MNQILDSLLLKIKGYELYIIVSVLVLVITFSIITKSSSSSTKSNNKSTKSKNKSPKLSSTPPTNNSSSGNNSTVGKKSKSKLKEEIREKEKELREKEKESSNQQNTGNGKLAPQQHKLYFKNLRAGDTVNSLAISPDGKYLSFCGLDRSIKMFMYDTMVSNNKTPPQSFNLQLPFDNATCVSWGLDSGSGNQVIYATLNESKKLIAFGILNQKNSQGKSYEQLWSVPLEQKSNIKSICSSEKSSYILTCGEDTIVKIWTLKGQLIQSINTSQVKAFNAAMSPDGRFFSLSTFSSEVKVFEALKKKDGQIDQCKRVMSLSGFKMSIYSICFSSDASKIITSSKDQTIKLYSLNVKYSLDVDPELLYSVVVSEVGIIDLISISPDDQVVAGVNQNYICFLNLSNGSLIDTIELNGIGKVNSLVWSKDSKYLITGGDDKQLYFWLNPKKL